MLDRRSKLRQHTQEMRRDADKYYKDAQEAKRDKVTGEEREAKINE